MNAKIYYCFRLLLLTCIVAAVHAEAMSCSIAGTASSAQSPVCENSNATLYLTGYLGAIQWQHFDGTMWVDETVPGATSDTFQVSLLVTTDFRAVVTELGCPSDTSNIVTIVVGVAAPAVTGDTRCGYGPVTLTATGGGSTIRWYDSPVGGSFIATGNSYSPNVSTTTTFYATSVIGGGPPSPITTTFASNNGFNGNMFDIIATNTVTIDSIAANLNAGTDTAEIWYKVGTHVGFTGSNAAWTFVGSAVYTSTGNGAPGTMINVYINVTIPAGETYAFYVHGGGGIRYTDGTAVGNIYVSDANLAITEGFGGDYFNLINSPRIFNGTVFYSAGCESTREPVVATVTPSDPLTISAVPPALCQGQSSTISVSSNNTNYNYTWSPGTALSGTTGTSNTANPMAPITYYIVGDDGTCGAIDSVFIDVGPASVAGLAAISTDTICLGTDAFLTLSGSTGNIQWQGNNGSGWVNETGTGNNTANYAVSPAADMMYRAVVASGGCDPDTSIDLSLTVISITDPIGVNDTICAPGNANLTASGPGTLNWYTSPAGGTPVYTGPGFSPNVSATTTYYVEAAAGSVFPTGAPDLGIGSQLALAGNNYGLQFDVIQQCVIEQVFVSPGITSGNITINLRDMAGGPVLNTVTVPVNSFSGLVPVNLGFTVNPGTGYRLELATGSVQLYYNSTGGMYPYTPSGGPLTITSALNPNPTTTGYYYFFYNWQVKLGCSSNLVPVTAFVNAPPPVPTVMQNGTILTSSAASGNQWNLDGSPIPGATGTTYDMGLSGSGSFTVTVTVDGCSSTSQPVIYVSVPEALQDAGINMYPNPVSHALNIALTRQQQNPPVVKIFDASGKLLHQERINGTHLVLPMNVQAGTYAVQINLDSGSYVTRIVKL